MRRKIFAAAALLSFIGLGRAHGMGGAEAAVGMLIEKTQLEVLAENVLQYVELYNSVQTAYTQLTRIEDMAEKEVSNFKKLDPSKMNFKDWMNFANEQAANEQRMEDTFRSIRLNAGGRSYNMTDIDDLDRMNADLESGVVGFKTKDNMTESDRRRLWERAGMTSSNYAYMKVWQEREKAAGRKIEAWSNGELDRRQQAAAKDQQDAEDAAAAADGANGIAQAQIASNRAANDNLNTIQDELRDIGAEMHAVNERNKYIPSQHDYSSHQNLLKEKSPYGTTGGIYFDFKAGK